MKTLATLSHRETLAARAMLALWVAGVAATLTWTYWAFPHAGVQSSDFSIAWAGARGLLSGVSPYTVVGPGRAIEWDFPLLYPMPAVVAAVPLSYLPLQWADPVVVALGTGVLAWTLTGRGLANPQLLVFASAAMFFVVETSQWSPLLTAAAFLPAGFGALFACKPTVGLAMLCAYPRPRALVAAAAFFVATLMIWPWWLAEWLAVLPAGTHIVAPVTLWKWGGPLVLLGLLRWRRPEARLLVALACVPQTPLLYEAVPLFLVPATWLESGVLTALTFGCVALQGLAAAPHTYERIMAATSHVMMVLLYLPCLVMVLRRPNVASPGDPLQAVITRLCAAGARTDREAVST